MKKDLVSGLTNTSSKGDKIMMKNIKSSWTFSKEFQLLTEKWLNKQEAGLLDLPLGLPQTFLNNIIDVSVAVKGDPSSGKTALLQALCCLKCARSSSTLGLQTLSCLWPVRLQKNDRQCTLRFNFFDCSAATLRSFPYIQRQMAEADVLVHTLPFTSRNSLNSLIKELKQRSFEKGAKKYLVAVTFTDQLQRAQMSFDDLVVLATDSNTPVIPVSLSSSPHSQLSSPRNEPASAPTDHSNIHEHYVCFPFST
eukprot:GCRY01003972.1.p1 GENE.GCRY01003972.1~~GCRY01003972.1.p1  ORF type:complete len:252 (+),score=36.31 GCRY01003972.1:169-924(+)